MNSIKRIYRFLSCLVLLALLTAPAALADEIPAGRLASPEEIASGLLKLLEMPEYCSGEIIRMDGCWL